MEAAPIGPGVRIGHVHLKVADVDRALAFYCGVLGFELTQKIGPPPAGSTGLYHLAILYPTRAELAGALRRVMAANIPLDGASDHGVSEALYLRDPDDNGVELYWDRPKALWPRTADGELAMFTRRLDLNNLLAEAGDAPQSQIEAPLFEPARGA
jgi:catechol 2,3-dioxygenase